MEERVSNIRINVLVNEYLNQIDKYKDKYSNYSNFPYLTTYEFQKAFNSKKIEARSHFRMLSLALLCEYISVTLNNMSSPDPEIYCI